jgi:tetratricopeptide (TPR) repeat protein
MCSFDISLRSLDGKGFGLAIRCFDEAIRLDPALPKAFHNRGSAHAKKGNHDLAIADRTEAIRLDPTLAPTYICRGFAYTGTEEYQRAVADYTAALRLDPSPALAYKERGTAHRRVGDFEKAVAQALPARAESILRYYRPHLTLQQTISTGRECAAPQVIVGDF